MTASAEKEEEAMMMMRNNNTNDKNNNNSTEQTLLLPLSSQESQQLHFQQQQQQEQLSYQELESSEHQEEEEQHHERYGGGPGRQYFTEYSWEKGVFYGFAVLYVLLTTLVVMLVEPIFGNMIPCHNIDTSQNDDDDITYENPLYHDDPCRRIGFWQLLFLTRDECAFGRRIVVSVILGGIIGWERRQADRPAGIRTMSLVSLGSCLFTLASTFAFESGPMAWDASRVAAAIPSGVGFLGAGLIWKNAERNQDSGETTHQVHGLTTAASLWLSAAVGICVGGAQYFVAFFGTAIMLVLLRFGPRIDDHVGGGSSGGGAGGGGGSGRGGDSGSLMNFMSRSNSHSNHFTSTAAAEVAAAKEEKAMPTCYNSTDDNTGNKNNSNNDKTNETPSLSLEQQQQHDVEQQQQHDVEEQQQHDVEQQQQQQQATTTAPSSSSSKSSPSTRPQIMLSGS